LIGTTVVVDAVVHPYDLGPANRDPEGADQLHALHPFHVMCSGGSDSRYVLEPDEFFVDFDHDALTHALFAESPVDLAIIHALPNLGFTKRGITDPARMAALRDRYPGRYLFYGTVDTPVTDAAIKQLEDQVANLGLDGLKLYPSFFYDRTALGWRLDDRDFAFPLLEAAQDLGIRNVAIHKTVPVPPAPAECFEVDDLDGALGGFPAINFHMVHAGVAFLPETARLMARHQNLYANLESSFSYILTKPRRFAEMLGTLLAAGGPDRLLFGSGVNLVHPRPLLEAFATFEMALLTDEVRQKILGRNALRAHGLDPAAVRERIDGDEFETIKAERFSPPWSLLRQGVSP
jgi:predicted TIM-barrel fold metal-dependent hydrolase